MRGYATCPVRGKLCHRTLASAKKAINRLAARQVVDTHVGPLIAHWCRWCGHFHIAHQARDSGRPPHDAGPR